MEVRDRQHGLHWRMTIAISLLIGAFAGLVAALCGVGGGIIMVPAFVLFLGLTQKSAVATSLAAIAATAIAASIKNNANAFVEWRIAIPAALASVIVAWFAADALKRLSNQNLQIIFAVLLIGVGIHTLWSALRTGA